MTLLATSPDLFPAATSARDEYSHVDFDALNNQTLLEITQQNGVDFATTLLFNRLQNSSKQGDFIRSIDAIDPSHQAPHLPGKLLIAPAAFYRKHPKFGGDGTLIRQIATQFKLPTGLLPVSSTGSVSKNATTIAEALELELDNSITLASLSKGGADVRIALERWPHLAKKIRVWLNICGLVRGTPISNSLLGTRWWQRGLLKGYLAYTRAHQDFVSELASTPNSLLGGSVNLPTNLRIINVVAFPLRQHLAGHSRTRHNRLAKFGPNDGSTLLRDSIIEPGDIYPVWAADHFMRTKEVPSLLHRLLAYTEKWT